MRNLCKFLEGLHSIGLSLSVFYELRDLSHHGIFSLFDSAFSSPDLELRLSAASILASLIENEAELVRSFILSQLRQKKPDLVSLLISRFLLEQDSGLKSQLAEMIRAIVDNSRQDTPGAPAAPSSAVLVDTSDMDDFLNRFYDDLLPKLLEPLTNLEGSFDSKSGGLRLSRDEVDTLNYLCEIICFTVKKHTFRIKYFLIASKISTNLMLLLRSKESHLRLGM